MIPWINFNIILPVNHHTDLIQGASFFSEISKEQEKEIEQFMHHGQNKSKFQRGRGRGNFRNARGQQRMGLNRGQRLGYPANQNNRNNHLPPAFHQEAQFNQIRHQVSEFRIICCFLLHIKGWMCDILDLKNAIAVIWLYVLCLDYNCFKHKRIFFLLFTIIYVTFMFLNSVFI